MADPDLVDRLAALPALAEIPCEELTWLATHGRVEVHEVGSVVAPKGVRIEYLWVILSGKMAVHVDRGAGPRRVIEWNAGEVSGMLPYSRMTGPPGDNFIERRSELLMVHEDHFPEMIRRCPRFTAFTVHLMLDRARSFNTSALQDEKMISLGKLSAGLAHELNNPASAMVRAAKLLMDSVEESDTASLALGGAGLTREALDTIAQVRTACLAGHASVGLSSIERADLEDEIADWLELHGSDPGLAMPLADAGVTLDALDRLAAQTPGTALDAALRWIAAGCSTRSLAVSIEQAATRTYDLVAAVKGFTYMDNLAGPVSVDVAVGLRDTIRVLASKVKDKDAEVTLDVEDDLPAVRANGGELNQVWMNLIDNALDVVSRSGRVQVRAAVELNRVVVYVTDDGPGIAEDVLPRIFDPFFTTKAPGRGTGLGLDIARRLVRRNQGEVTVQSRPGRTEFRVSLAPAELASAEVE